MLPFGCNRSQPIPNILADTFFSKNGQVKFWNQPELSNHRSRDQNKKTEIKEFGVVFSWSYCTPSRSIIIFSQPQAYPQKGVNANPVLFFPCRYCTPSRSIIIFSQPQPCPQKGVNANPVLKKKRRILRTGVLVSVVCCKWMQLQCVLGWVDLQIYMFLHDHTTHNTSFLKLMSALMDSKSSLAVTSCCPFTLTLNTLHLGLEVGL